MTRPTQPVSMPRPAAVQLITRARNTLAPKPPFGLATWSTEADAIAVLLEGNPMADDPATIASQIPHAKERPPGTVVFVFAVAARNRNPLRRWLSPWAVSVSRAARCTALLARGYAALGVGADPASGIDVAWGRTPQRAAGAAR